MRPFRKTLKRIRFEEGLAFHRRSFESWLWFAFLVGSSGVYVWRILSRALDGGAPFVPRDLMILFPAGFLALQQAVWWMIPTVRVTAGGLRVRGKLVRFEQITTIEMEETNSRCAVLGVGENNRITLYNQSDWEPSSFGSAMLDLANRAGVEITYTKKIKERLTRVAGV